MFRLSTYIDFNFGESKETFRMSHVLKAHDGDEMSWEHLLYIIMSLFYIHNDVDMCMLFVAKVISSSFNCYVYS